MSKLTVLAENQIKETVINALKKAMEKGELVSAEIPDFKVEIPADTSHGDYSANAAMVGARAFRTAPVKIAQTIVDNADLSGTYFEKLETAGPGFLNFFLSPLFNSETVLDVLEQKENYGKSDYGQGKRVLVEFVSANPTGPMHIGNARGGALGDCLASVMNAAGYKADREFYINDSGNQIEKFSLSLDIRYRQACGEEVEMPEDSYHGQDIIDHVNAYKEQFGDALMSKDEAERKKELCAFALPKNIEGLERDLKKYKIVYDKWFKESTLHNDGSVKWVVEELKKRGYTYEQEGAVWFKATEFGADKDFVLVRANGFATYVVPDIAYHYNKLTTRGYDMAIDILGADHHGYVPRLKAALTALGVDADRLTVVLMQMVRLVRNGEIIKASKRSGKAITLVTLLEEVPVDAARFYFNLREANSPFDFDLDLAVENTSQNPVYYVQYAHARICSIFKNLAAEGINPRTVTAKELCCLTADEEKELIRHIASFSEEISECARLLDPTGLTKYAVTLATLFHKFYNACRVKCDDEVLMQSRLALCEAVRQTIKNTLDILKIDSPEIM